MAKSNINYKAIGAVLVVAYLVMYVPMIHDKFHLTPMTNYVVKFFTEGSYNASSPYENAVFTKLQQAAEGAVLNKPLACKNKLYEVAMTIKGGAPTKYTTDTLALIWDEYSNRVIPHKGDEDYERLKDGAINSIRKASEYFVKGKVDDTFNHIIDAHQKCREWHEIASNVSPAPWTELKQPLPRPINIPDISLCTRNYIFTHFPSIASKFEQAQQNAGIFSKLTESTASGASEMIDKVKSGTSDIAGKIQSGASSNTKKVQEALKGLMDMLNVND